MKAKRSPDSIRIQKVECLPVIHQITLALPKSKKPSGGAKEKRFKPSADSAEIVIPIVDGWLQLNLTVESNLQSSVALNLDKGLRKALRDLRKNRSFDLAYAIHKPPGLRLRIRLTPWGLNAGNLEAKHLTPLTSWIETALQQSGIRGASFDSFLEQHHLWGELSRSEVHAILDLSFAKALDARLRNRTCTPKIWAEFLVDFLNIFYLDNWWVWEALKRHRTLRTQFYAYPPSARSPLYDPRALLVALKKNQAHSSKKPDLKGSTSLLLMLSYLLNIWAIDPKTEDEILNKALEMVAPALL